MDLPPDRIQHFTDEIRHENYRPLYDMTAGYTDVSQLQHAAGLLRLHWIIIDMNSPMVGNTIGQMDIRNRTGVTISGVMRAGKLFSNPTPDFIFENGDMIGVLGTSGQLSEFKKISNVS